MAEIRKFIDQAAAQALVEQIKAEDAKTLASAKTYADGLADNYDAAGAAATAEQNAKAHAEEKVKELADGQVETNKTDIAAIKADYLKASDKTELQGNIDTLEEYVGTFTDEEATTVIEYVDKKTSGIASDTKVKELENKVTDVTNRVAAVEEDYLKAEDKTELAGQVTTEKERAEAIEAGLRTDVDAIKADYLKAEDKSALETKISDAKTAADNAQTHSEGVASDLAKEAEDRKSVDSAHDTRIKDLEGKITGLTGAMHFRGVKEALPEEVSDYAEGDVIIVGEKEYVFNGTEFKEFGDVSAEGQRIAGLETRMTTAEGEIDSLQADFGTVNTTLGTKADKSALEAEVTARTDADSALDTRIKAVEDKMGPGEGSVGSQIDKAKEDAITAAAADATTKADKALTDAKTYADTEVEKDRTRIAALETDSHTHENKDLLDTYTQTEANLADAVAKKHAHANGVELDKIVDGDVAKWNAAEQNAKDYADGLNTTVTAEITKVSESVAANTAEIAKKADKETLDTLSDKVTTNEAAIAANKTAIESFVEITAEEIKAMFA